MLSVRCLCSPTPHTFSCCLSGYFLWVPELQAQGRSFSLQNQLSAAEELKSRHKPPRRHAFSVRTVTENKNPVLKASKKETKHAAIPAPERVRLIFKVKSLTFVSQHGFLYFASLQHSYPIRYSFQRALAAASSWKLSQ